MYVTTYNIKELLCVTYDRVLFFLRRIVIANKLLRGKQEATLYLKPATFADLCKVNTYETYTAKLTLFRHHNVA